MNVLDVVKAVQRDAPADLQVTRLNFGKRPKRSGLQIPGKYLGAGAIVDVDQLSIFFQKTRV